MKAVNLNVDIVETTKRQTCFHHVFRPLKTFSLGLQYFCLLVFVDELIVSNLSHHEIKLVIELFNSDP